MDWTALLVAEDENPRSRLVTELLASDAYGSMEARAAAFVRQGGGCRATFFNYRSERVIRCRFIFSGKNGELTPDFCVSMTHCSIMRFSTFQNRTVKPAAY